VKTTEVEEFQISVDASAKKYLKRDYGFVYAIISMKDVSGEDTVVRRITVFGDLDRSDTWKVLKGILQQDIEHAPLV
jgi:hypothetical protein